MNEHGMIICGSNGWESQERLLPERTTKKRAIEILYELHEEDVLGLEWSLWIDGECVLSLED